MKVGQEIKVRFATRGKLKHEVFTGDFIKDMLMSAESSKECLGIAETPWAEFVEMREDGKFIAKLLNDPVHQLVHYEDQLVKLKWGDYCVFKIRTNEYGNEVKEFDSLHRLGEQ